MLRFAGFELDQTRAELRGPDGEAIRLRPKTFDLLRLFAANPGRILSKQELMSAVWPNVHVSEDSLFQCVKEIRAALGDDKRQLIKVVSGRGYLLEVEVEVADPAGTAAEGQSAHSGQAPSVEPGATTAPAANGEPAKHRWPGFGVRRRVVLAAVVGLAIVGLAIAAPMLRSGSIFARGPVTLTVIAIADTSDDPLAARMAADVTGLLADGLARIETIRVVNPSVTATAADLVVNAELERTERSWNVHARMTETATGEVKWTTSLAVDLTDPDVQIQQSRLAAGIGHTLALRIDALLHPDQRSADGLPAGSAKVAIEQAAAHINQTTPERFRAAQAMLEQALADDPDNVDLQVALAALQLRGIQMVWYPPAERDAAENNAKTMLERALRAKPNHIPVLEAYCRFLNATNRFVESLVACARTLTQDPWNGIALYHIGLAQIQLGRFEDALATFKQADRFDTPQVARWTWLLGAGWTDLLMGRAEDALPWLQRSIAITPASGRSLMLLAVAYQQLGRADEAKAALAKALELRPGSTARNVPPPTKNASPVYLDASERLIQLMVAAGLPEG